jgi:hypothetical protein
MALTGALFQATTTTASPLPAQLHAFMTRDEHYGGMVGTYTDSSCSQGEQVWGSAVSNNYTSYYNGDCGQLPPNTGSLQLFMIYPECVCKFHFPCP